MKTLFRSVILLTFSLQVSLFSGCEQNDDIDQHIVPQASLPTCSHLSTSDLELSEGFRGAYQGNSSTADSDFSILKHDGVYSFGEEIESGDCKGICSFRVIFEPADPQNPVESAFLYVSNVSLTYHDGSNLVTSSNIAYDWNYPYLDIGEVVTNAVVDYDISFLNNMGPNLSVADVQVVGGLCVIDNVDIIDPPQMYNVFDPKSPHP